MESEFIVGNFAPSPGSRKCVVRKGEKRAWKQKYTHMHKLHPPTHRFFVSRYYIPEKYNCYMGSFFQMLRCLTPKGSRNPK